MPTTKQKVTEEEVSLRFNLKDMFGTAVADETIVQDMANSIIDTIRNRTLSGFGVWEDGSVKRFKKYTKEYATKKGVGVGDVDLELTGSMLDSIELLDYSPQTFSIGIIGPDAPKAHGHMTGQNGVGPLPKRPFLNVTERDIKAVVKDFTPDVNALQDKSAQAAMSSKRADNLGFTEADIIEAIRLLQSGKGPRIL